ncbi:MAG: 4-hydroxy-tetrahydrodipicolinate reductase [Proteobacteria bacterium]|nr:4-hydroxy-tetrahydrodipicolinate reductase [Pseudomonadota bacterium]
MADLRVGVAGAAGRMGQLLVREVSATAGLRLAAATEVASAPALGRDAGEVAGVGTLGVAIGDDAAAMFAAVDVMLDFTAPAAAPAHARLAALHGTALVIGTTGLKAPEEAALKEAAGRAAVVYAANFSPGVNLMFALAEEVARTLDDAYDIEIVEMHHRHKVDAPSGTALQLGRRAARGRGVSLEAAAVRGRDGHTGARPRGAIGFAALRGGDVVGEHTVVFATDGERIEITHRASARRIYAAGAARAALWTKGREPGLYDMFDVLGMAR